MKTTEVRPEDLTPAKMAEMSAHAIAAVLGLGYMGDCNVMDHDGYFYNTKHWEKDDYADCLAFTRADGKLYVELGTIHREDDMDTCLQVIGYQHSLGKPNVEVQIEACHATWGLETAEDFDGKFVQTFTPDEWGYIDEEPVWEAIKGWLFGLMN